MENKLFVEQCARANAETWAQPFSADRDASHKEIKLVKSREASLNVQTSEMNAAIKRHQEMYDRLENRFQLALRSNEILTKEVNHGRAEYLGRIQAFKKSHENPHKILCQTDPKETTLTIKLRERNRDLVCRVKRLEKANSVLSSRLRLEDMDPEALVLMVEGLELDKIDWVTLSPDPQTRQALNAIYKIELEDDRDHDTLTVDIARAKVRFAEIRADKQHKAEEAAGLPAPPPLMVTVLVTVVDCSSRSLAACLHSSYSTSFQWEEKQSKGKAKRQRTGSDDEDVDFGGGDSGEDAREEGRECSATYSPAATSQPQPKKQKASPPASPPTPAEKSQSQQSSKSSTKSSSVKPSSGKSFSSKSDVPEPALHLADAAPKKVDTAVSEAESMSSLTPKRKAAVSSEFRSFFRLVGGSRSAIQALTSESSPGQSTKSSPTRSKKTRAKAKSGRSSSDESVVSVSSESESESSSDQDSSASEGSDAHEDEESELAKLRPERQCLEDLSDDSLDAPAPASTPAAGSQAVEPSPTPTPKAKSASTTKTSSKKVTSSKKKSKSSSKASRPSKKAKSQDVTRVFFGFHFA
ncbi:hypothetical protein PHMEG_00029128 [Phytophthora megakarya]|uniref:Uncharacterized protein n=1 Tax=Phytophthora megakarya TaxID=4795 RepID=A0A225V2T3_9STRA|nr:hypothetical protein PHMEG_00029128 [Phytophthora megakarya]